MHQVKCNVNYSYKLVIQEVFSTKKHVIYLVNVFKNSCSVQQNYKNTTMNEDIYKNYNIEKYKNN